MLLDKQLDRGNDRFLKIRNWLNIIFILGAIAGYTNLKTLKYP